MKRIANSLLERSRRKRSLCLSYSNDLRASTKKRHWPPENRAIVSAKDGLAILTPMRRMFSALLLLAVLVWQTVSVAEQGPLRKHSEEQAHAQLHWQQTEHHHHDDGSVQMDDSAESIQHLVADAALSFVAIWSSASTQVDFFRPPPPASSAAAGIPDPNPERIKRPPRLAA